MVFSFVNKGLFGFQPPNIVAGRNRTVKKKSNYNLNTHERTWIRHVSCRAFAPALKLMN